MKQKRPTTQKTARSSSTSFASPLVPPRKSESLKESGGGEGFLLTPKLEPQVWGLLLMEEILHQLRLVIYPIIYRVLYIRGGAGFVPATLGGGFNYYFSIFTAKKLGRFL